MADGVWMPSRMYYINGLSADANGIAKWIGGNRLTAKINNCSFSLDCNCRGNCVRWLCVVESVNRRLTSPNQSRRPNQMTRDLLIIDRGVYAVNCGRLQIENDCGSHLF